MKKWKISLGKFLADISGKLPTKRISAYLKEKGFRVDPRSIGRQMKRWGFGVGRFYEGKEQVRGYEVLPGQVKAITEKVTKKRSVRKGFRCYFHKPPWEGFYDLPPDEEIIGNGSRIIKKNNPGNEKICYCPVCDNGSHRAYYNASVDTKGLKDKIVFKVSGHDFEGRWLGNQEGYHGPGALDIPENLKGEW